jgi:hypothetical protein
MPLPPIVLLPMPLALPPMSLLLLRWAATKESNSSSMMGVNHLAGIKHVDW